MASKFITTLLSLVILGAICFLGYQYFTGGIVIPEQKETTGFLRTERELRDKLAEFQLQRNEVTTRIERLEEGKMKALEKLKTKGVKSSSDLDLTDKEVKGWVKEISSSRKSIKLLEESADRYTEAISRIEARLDDMLRKEITESVAISEEDDLELRRIVADVEDHLGLDQDDVIQEEEWAKILDDEMAADDGSE